MSEITATSSHRFFIFRHGLATKSTTGYGDQILTATLLPEGIPAIEKLAEYLKDIPSNFRYSSELPRCRQTAEIVTKATGQPFEFDPRINEYHQEPFQKFTERVDSFLEEVIEKADRACIQQDCNEMPATIWICTHGAVIAALKHLLLEGSFSQEYELDYTQPGEILEIWKQNLQLHIFN
jgi:broad specificity phosphatase PhoE